MYTFTYIEGTVIFIDCKDRQIFYFKTEYYSFFRKLFAINSLRKKKIKKTSNKTIFVLK